MRATGRATAAAAGRRAARLEPGCEDYREREEDYREREVDEVEWQGGRVY
jgi:hypothetical protein